MMQFSQMTPKFRPHCLASLQLLLLLQITPPLMAAEDSKQARFKVSAAKGYMPIEPALRNYLSDQAGNGKGVQHFCVVGYKLPSKNAAKRRRTAWVHWLEGRRLVQWSPAAEGFTSSDTLLHSARDLDLSKDAKTDPTSVGSSTYVVDHLWVKQLLQDCRIRGEEITILQLQ